MKDLKIKYKYNGETLKKEYDCIFDFTDAIQNKETDAPPLEGTDVEALFFENELHKETFPNIRALVKHCEEIMR